MTTKTYDYTTPANYTYNTTKVEVTGGKAQLKLQEASQVWNEDFADDTGHTYDNTKAEFTGGLVQQKSNKAAGSTFAATYNTNIDGTYGDGSLTGTAFSGATVTSNKLDLTSAGAYVTYPVVGNADHTQIMSFKFKFTPSYSGTPANRTTLVAIDTGTINSITFKHENNGSLYLLVRDSGGSSIVVMNQAWSPTSGQEYEFEVGIDITNGNSFFYVDTARSAVNTGTGTRVAPSYFAIGGGSGSKGTIDDFILFDALQNTGATKTTGYVIEDSQYEETAVTLPEFAHSGVGNILTATTLVTTEAGSPRYTINRDQSGVYEYWDGAAWSTSDGTYAQANDKATFSANLATLDVDGDLYTQMKVHFTNSVTQSSVADLTLNHTGHIGYPTDNPSVITNSSFNANEISAFTSTENITGSDTVTHAIVYNGTDYYFDGADWVTSSGFAQTNTQADINTNISSFAMERDTIALKTYLHSDTGQSTPDIDTAIFTFLESLADPSLATSVLFHGFLYGHQGPISNSLIKIRPYDTGSVCDGVFHVYDWENYDTTNSDGYFQGLVFANCGTQYWELRIGKQRYKVQIPDQDSVDISTLTVTKVI